MIIFFINNIKTVSYNNYILKLLKVKVLEVYKLIEEVELVRQKEVLQVSKYILSL